MGTRDFLFFGHRTSGKSTLARELGQRGWIVVDVDEVIENRLGKTCAEVITEDESIFRKTEVEVVHALACDSHTLPRIIVCGAGLEVFPAQPIGVWISRDGWEDSAGTERSRLRPQWPFEREIQWMKDTREARYRDAADVHFHMPRGRTVKRAVDELEDMLGWLDGPSPFVAGRTFMVLPHPKDLLRAEARVQRLGLAGLEIRSDFAQETHPQTPYLASLRTNQAHWLREHPDAPWDIDIRFLDAALKAGVFDFPPRRLVLSAHLDSMKGFEQLRAARETLPPAWRPFAELKFAPQCTDSPLPVPDAETFIPQGPELAWMRHVLCQRNALNYISLGLCVHHGGLANLPPLDLQDWLPFWGLNLDSSFDALLGQPAIQSQGDWWHRRAALAAGQNRGYLKIACASQAFQNTLGLVRDLGVQNLSITSPLKSLAGEVCGSDSPLNTLRWDRVSQKWRGKDTDAVGMVAALEVASELCGTALHHAVILGSGAVTPAVQRALNLNQWTFEEVSGRSTDPIPRATLLINTTGRAVLRPHQAHVQLDLHYTSVEPSRAPIHLNGDVFFEAQAVEQRRFWFQGV